jgi:nanoRNase/pAp phosphatase (c-di-AMP/oligoRNAs hydrolase)
MVDTNNYFQSGEPRMKPCVYLLPDYLNDLNAMHEAEKVLTREQLDTYLYELHELIGHNHIERYAVTATAAQRAEAFLKTLNLWNP